MRLLLLVLTAVALCGCQTNKRNSYYYGTHISAKTKNHASGRAKSERDKVNINVAVLGSDAKAKKLAAVLKDKLSEEFSAAGYNITYNNSQVLILASCNIVNDYAKVNLTVKRLYDNRLMGTKQSVIKNSIALEQLTANVLSDTSSWLHSTLSASTSGVITDKITITNAWSDDKEAYALKFIEIVSKMPGVISVHQLNGENNDELICKITYSASSFPAGIIYSACLVPELNIKPGR